MRLAAGFVLTSLSLATGWLFVTILGKADKDDVDRANDEHKRCIEKIKTEDEAERKALWQMIAETARALAEHRVLVAQTWGKYPDRDTLLEMEKRQEGRILAMEHRFSASISDVKELLRAIARQS
jgi:hypothetical protein